MRYLLLLLLSATIGVAIGVFPAPLVSRGGASQQHATDTARAARAGDTSERAIGPQDTTARARGLTELKRAAERAEAGQVDAALLGYERAASLLPAIEDWIALHAARAAASAGDTAAVRMRLAVAGDRLAREFGWREPLRALEEAGAVEQAIALADELAASSAGVRRATAATTAGRLRLLRGDTAGARAAFRTAVSSSGSAYDAARFLSDLSGLTAEDHLTIGRIYLRGGNMERAARGIRAYLDAGRGTAAERRRLRLDLGRGFFRAGDYASAARELRAAADGAPAATAAPALYDAARADYRRGDVAGARAALRSIGERFPGSASAARAWYLLGDLDQDAMRLDDARASFRRAIDSGADSDEVGLAWMRLAGMAFAAGDLAEARDRFDGYRTRYPNGRRVQQATYWSGVASLELGDTTTARARFDDAWRRDPMTYYGARAAERLAAAFLEDLALGASPAVADLPAVASAALDRVDLLRDAGWDEAAAFEMNRARDSFGSDSAALYALAEALNQRGYTAQGISLGWDLRRRTDRWNPRLLRIVYPLPYREAIVAEARRHGIDPFLAAGLIRQESMFNARAVSPAGAVGLMQVMPATGRTIARRLDILSFDPELLRNPQVNIRIGMQFLADMLGEYAGRVDAVLAAYNAGPSRLDRWQEFPEWEDPELFSERIPYEETRDYVKIVQQNARLYRALYGDGALDP